MENLKKNVYRPSGKITDFMIFSVILTLLMLIVGELLSGIVGARLGVEHHLAAVFGDKDVGFFLNLYLSFWGIWIVFFIIISVFKNNRPMWKCLSLRKGVDTFPVLLAGLLLGFGSNGFCILMSCILGDIKLSFYRFDPVLLISFILVVLVQSGAEEVLTRCYMYQKLRRRYRHPAVAIVGNALFFMALHLFNPGISVRAILDLVLTGIIFSLIVYYYGSLWCAILFHLSWNFTQSIAFGLPNSGLVSKYSLFKLEAASARDGLFYTVNFGVEGSYGSIAILAVIAVVILFINRGRGEKADIWEQMEIDSAEAARRKAEARLQEERK